MAKSIRSKIMKRHRAVMRRTVGEAQEQKTMRKALRRLRKAVEDQTVGGAAAGGSTLAGIAAALGGAVPPAAAVGGAGAGAVDAIKVPIGPARTKALRYTFNSSLRAARVAADLEDLTDDEEDVRLGRVDVLRKKAAAAAKAAAGGGAGGIDEEADDDEEEVLEFRAGASSDVVDVVEEAGLKKAAGRAAPKRGVYAIPVSEAKPAAQVGYYDSDPLFAKDRNVGGHRKGKLRQKIEAAAFGKPKK